MRIRNRVAALPMLNAPRKMQAHLAAAEVINSGYKYLRPLKDGRPARDKTFRLYVPPDSRIRAADCGGYVRVSLSLSLEHYR